MKKRMVNQETIVGKIFQHKLEIKTVQNEQSANYGKPFISGTIDVATDPDLINVIPVHYTYVAETTKAGNTNSTFTALKKIIETGKTVVENGADEATCVKLSPSIALNDFYTTDNNGEETLVSAIRNEGGFVNFVSNLDNEIDKEKFVADMVITSVVHQDANPEREGDVDKVVVKGAIFDFRGSLLPVSFVVKDESGMNYFEDLGASKEEPVFTQVWGRIVSETKTVKFEQESAFGEAAVRTTTRKNKEYLITGARTEPYDFDTEETITAAELKKAAEDRNVYLADVKKRNDEYKASLNTANNASSSELPFKTNEVKKQEFNF